MISFQSTVVLLGRIPSSDILTRCTCSLSFRGMRRENPTSPIPRRSRASQFFNCLTDRFSFVGLTVGVAPSSWRSQPVVAQVAYHDVTGTTKAADGGCHAPDQSSPGDQDILPDSRNNRCIVALPNGPRGCCRRGSGSGLTTFSAGARGIRQGSVWFTTTVFSQT